MTPAPRIGIVTISDRASQGVYADESGPAIEHALRDYLATACVYELRLVPTSRTRSNARCATSPPPAAASSARPAAPARPRAT